LFGFDEDEAGDNELLGANGKVGRDFLNFIAELTPVAEHEDFISPAKTESEAVPVLLEIQSDIFELKSGPAKVKRSVAPSDRSLQIHSCHSIVRELEVLHDHLLDLFQEDSALKPKDIIVMMPDVSIYAPFIDAVFGVPENPKQKIPYSTADREARAGSGVIDTFFRILEILPFDEIQGSNTELLGNFLEFVEQLFSRANEFSKPRPLSEWQRDLRETLDAFFAADEAAQRELNRLRAAIAALGEIGAAAQN